MTRPAITLFVMLLCLTTVAAFTSPKSYFVMGGVSSAVSSSSQIFMSSDPLEEVAEGASASAEPMEATTIDESNIARNYGRAGEIKEVKWVDPAMVANTNPLKMSFWAYFLFGWPLVLLADDLFHIVPDFVKDSPVGFLF
ncbi:unnamed protein product [Cylindrotheca closterium]|uniref:Uncharacterized protein n=1 Tax=Cylindrotheca closterium TaxID=2856 RepID=A0AAD2CQN3_9STRA|nr:unnamed protein product [Cylindrotheca closterium]